MEPEIQIANKPMHDRRHLYVTWGAIIIAIAAIAASSFVVRGAHANADYICTHIIDEDSDCANGSWGDWQTVSSTNDAAACAVTKVENRTYTGTRTTKHILQYLNLRTSCDSGYSQVQDGTGSGASGFHGGNIITESTACQIQETRTTRNPGAGPQCANPNATTTTVTSAQTDIGTLNDATQAVQSEDALTQFRISMIAASIYAKPALVHPGGTTVVKWQGREVTSCTVTGTNGDSWTGTAGENTSGAISARTTYTLNCIAFNGQAVSDQATVDIAPDFQEI